VPSIGFAGCLVLVICAIGRRVRWQLFAPVALCFVMAVFAVRTWERNLDWHDDVTLWTAAERVSPNSFKTHDALAFALNEADPTHANISRITDEEEKSLAILDPIPDSINTQTTYANAGEFYIFKGDALVQREANGQVTQTQESLAAYQRALAILLRGAAIDRDYTERDRINELERGKLESQISPRGMALLHDQLALAYLRLGRNEDSYNEAVYARLLAPAEPDAYIVMGQDLSGAGRKEEAAIALTEGYLVSKDKRFLPLLQNLYQSGLDPRGCAITQTPGGQMLNNSCEITHRHICEAFTGVIRVSLESNHRILADSIKKKGVVEMGCTQSELQVDSGRPVP
jgi:tetratricopeptide (TPR) repeat protein